MVAYHSSLLDMASVRLQANIQMLPGILLQDVLSIPHCLEVDCLLFISCLLQMHEIYAWPHCRIKEERRTLQIVAAWASDYLSLEMQPRWWQTSAGSVTYCVSHVTMVQNREQARSGSISSPRLHDA